MKKQETGSWRSIGSVWNAGITNKEVPAPETHVGLMEVKDKRGKDVGETVKRRWLL